MTTVEQAAPPRVARELLDSAGFLLARLGYSIKARAIDDLAAAGFNTYDYGVLAILSEGARETQATIADALGLDRSQLVGILDGLEERSLIDRQRDPNDRRRHTVSLTENGRKQLAKVRSIVKKVEDEFLAPLDAGDRKTLHLLLLQLAGHHDPRCADPRCA
jgi:DNA-binding MarR family transcriptional regulator